MISLKNTLKNLTIKMKSQDLKTAFIPFLKKVTLNVQFFYNEPFLSWHLRGPIFI